MTHRSDHNNPTADRHSINTPFANPSDYTRSVSTLSPHSPTTRIFRSRGRASKVPVTCSMFQWWQKSRLAPNRLKRVFAITPHRNPFAFAGILGFVEAAPTVPGSRLSALVTEPQRARRADSRSPRPSSYPRDYDRWLGIETAGGDPALPLAPPASLRTAAQDEDDARQPRDRQLAQ